MASLHYLYQYFECYLWLSQRFPVEFVHAEKAARESKHCADLVEKALKSFADSAASISRKGKKSVVSFDKVFHLKKVADAATVTASDIAPAPALASNTAQIQTHARVDYTDETEFKAVHRIFPGRMKKSVNS